MIDILLKPTAIILHHSLTPDGQTADWVAIRNYHINENGWQDIGYHFGIELIKTNYEILAGRMLTEWGAHCKQAEMNFKSIGVCFIGNFDHQGPPAAQWRTGLRLVNSLRATYKIPRSRVFAHRDFADYKSCPGRMFDIVKFRAELL